MKSEDIILTKKAAKELKAIKRRKINLSDKDALEITNWDKAIVGKFYRPVKKQITIRLDADILDWFQHSTNKYQTLINIACREYMNHHKIPKSRDKHI